MFEDEDGRDTRPEPLTDRHPGVGVHMVTRPGIYHVEAGAGPSWTDLMMECTTKREALRTAVSAVRQRSSVVLRWLRRSSSVRGFVRLGMRQRVP